MSSLFDDLISLQVKGGDYTAQGVIIPSRRGTHEIRVETQFAEGKRLGVFVNGSFRTLCTVDAEGEAAVALILPRGEVEVLFYDAVTSQGVRAYLTVRATAAVAHAQADVLARVEATIDETQAALGLDGMSRRFAVTALAQLEVGDISAYNGAGLREVLRRMRSAYRKFYGTPLHISRLSAFCGSEPVLLPEAWRPRWVVAGSLYRAEQWDRERVFIGDLDALNAGAFDYVGTVEATVVVGSFVNPPVPQVLRVDFDAGWDGGTLTISGRDQSGLAVSEAFAADGIGAVKFAAVTSVTKSAVGTAGQFCRIGLGVSRRFAIRDIGPGVPIGTTYRIGTGAEVLGNDRRISDLAEGLTRIQLDRGQPVTLRSVPEPIVLSHSRLRLQIDRGPIQVVAFSPGSLTALDVVELVNTQLGTPARVTVDLTGNEPTEGSIDTIPYIGGTLDVEWLQTGDALTTGDVAAEFDYTTMGTPATVTQVVTIGAERAGYWFEYSPNVGVAPDSYVVVWAYDAPHFHGRTFQSVIDGRIVRRYYVPANSGNPGANDAATWVANAINADAVIPFSATIDSPTQITVTYDTNLAAINGLNVRSTDGAGYPPGQGSIIGTWSGGADDPTAEVFAPILAEAVNSAGVPVRARTVGTTSVEFILGPGAAGNGLSLTGLPGTFAGGSDSTVASLDGDTAVLSADNEIRLLPAGDDARFELFARPWQTEFAALAAPGDRDIVALRPTRMYGHPVDVELATVLDSEEFPAFAVLPYPTAIEVNFVGWTAGDLVLEGDVTETFEAPVGGTGVVVGEALFRTLTRIVGTAPVGVAVGYADIRLRNGVSNLGQTVRLGRDAVEASATEVLTWTAETVTGTALAAAATEASAWFYVADGPNAGMHEVLDVGGGLLTVLREGGGRFVADSTAREWTLRSRGFVYTALSTERLDRELTESYAIGDYIEPDSLATDFVVSSFAESTAWVDVFVDTSVPAVSGSTYVDLEVEGAAQPDGWVLRNATCSGLGEVGLFESLPLVMASGASADSSIAFYSDNAARHVGFPMRATAWVEQSGEDLATFEIALSFDNGRTFEARTRQVARGQTVRVDTQFDRVPVGAAPALVRLTWVDAPATSEWRIHRTILTAPIQTAYYMGSNTLARGANPTEVIYYWHPVAAENGEDEAMNTAVQLLPADLTWRNFAHPRIEGVYTDADWAACTYEGLDIDVALPAKHSSVVPNRVSLVAQSLNLSDLTLDVPASIATSDLLPRAPGPNDILFSNGVPVASAPADPTTASVDLVGGRLTIRAELEGDAANTLTVAIVAGAGTVPLSIEISPGGLGINLATVEGVLDPARNRIAYIASLVNTLEGYTAEYDEVDEAFIVTTAESATFSGAADSPWRFLSQDEIEIDPAVLNPAAEYSVVYDSLIRVTTTAIDLGTDHLDYLWIYDAPKWLRRETEPVEYTEVAVLTFRNDNTARLPVQANVLGEATLIRDDGLEAIELENFSFVDSLTVELQAVPQTGVRYTLTYTARSGAFRQVAHIVFESRAAAEESGLSAAPWSLVEPGTPAEPQRWRQMRATFENVGQVVDARLYGLGLKGIDLYSADAYAPGVGLRIEQPTLPPPEVPVVAFAVDAPTVPEGDSVELSWTIGGSVPMSVVINDGTSDVYVGSLVSGAVTLVPPYTTEPTPITYTLTAVNPDGTDQATAEVSVVARAPTVVLTGPSGTQYRSGPSIPVDLSWVLGGTGPWDLVINDGTTDVYSATGLTSSTGMTTIAEAGAAGTIVYTATVSNASAFDGVDTALVTVVDGAAPVINTFTVVPGSVELGSSVTVQWDVTSIAPSTTIEVTAEAVSIYSGSDLVSFVGDTPTAVDAAYEYEITATNAFGVDSAIVNVNVFADVPVATLSQLTPGIVYAGTTLQLEAGVTAGTPPMTWDVTGDTLGVVDSGTFSGIETDTVNIAVDRPSRTETFTLDVVNGAGSDDAVRNVSIVDPVNLFHLGGISGSSPNLQTARTPPSGTLPCLFVLISCDGPTLPAIVDYGGVFLTPVATFGLPNEQAGLWAFTSGPLSLVSGTLLQARDSGPGNPLFTFPGNWRIRFYRGFQITSVTGFGSPLFASAPIVDSGAIALNSPRDRVLSFSLDSGGTHSIAEMSGGVIDPPSSYSNGGIRTDEAVSAVGVSSVSLRYFTTSNDFAFGYLIARSDI